MLYKTLSDLALFRKINIFISRAQELITFFKFYPCKLYVEEGAEGIWSAATCRCTVVYSFFKPKAISGQRPEFIKA